MKCVARIPRAALILGWLGVIPFAACAVLTVTGGVLSYSATIDALVVYGAIILSFMGGAQWGLAMVTASADYKLMGFRLAVSVVPALVAFGLALMPSASALFGLATAFAALFLHDVALVGNDAAPAWYPALRAQLTAAVVACLIFGGIYAAR